MAVQNASGASYLQGAGGSLGLQNSYSPQMTLGGVPSAGKLTVSSAPKAATPTPTPAAVPPSSSDAQYNALKSQIDALNRQIAYQPKLPSYDIMGNYNRARSQAEAAVNPLYTKYLNDFLSANQVKRDNKGQEVGITKEGIAQELGRTLNENNVNRNRTTEDTTNAIADLNQQEGNFQQASGTQFDQDRRQLAENTAASGLTTSGIGQGKIYDQNNQRNLDEGQQVQEYTNQREAKKLFATRTFEDLARGDKDANDISANKNKAADFDLEQYLDELASDETQFRNENEVKRLGDVATQTNSYANQSTQSFLSSLAGAGWRPQDIALAYQVYG